MDGQSVYGKVIKFFKTICKNNNDMYAYVEWLGVPDYPMLGLPIVVRVRDNAPVVVSPSVISIREIDPSRVIIERVETENCYYMCRIEGTDTKGY